MLKMSERPLAIDVSKWQEGPFHLADLLRDWIGTDVDVHMVYSRAGVGTNFDPFFKENYQDSLGYYRTSYWAIDPMQDWQTQLDMWFEAHPFLDNMPRVIDAELHGDLTPAEFATFIKWFSDNILARDGVRPFIYAGYYTLRDYITFYNTAEWVEEHYYIVAHYGDGDADEDDDPAVVIPDKIPVNNVVYRQTTSKAYMPGYNAHFIDRNRFLLGEMAEVHEFYSQWAKNDPIPEPNLWAEIIRLENYFVKLDAQIARTAHEMMVKDNEIIDGVEMNLSANYERVSALEERIQLLETKTTMQNEIFKRQIQALKDELAEKTVIVKTVPWWMFWKK